MTSDCSTTAARLRERIAFGRDFHRLGAHDFAEAGQLDPHQPADRFGRDVARGDAGAAGGENEAAALRGEGADRFLDALELVGHDRFARTFQLFFERHFLQGRAAEIVVFARGWRDRKR